MKKYEKDLTVDELCLFMANNPTMTTANREVYTICFLLSKQKAMDKEIASDAI